MLSLNHPLFNDPLADLRSVHHLQIVVSVKLLAIYECGDDGCFFVDVLGLDVLSDPGHQRVLLLQQQLQQLPILFLRRHVITFALLGVITITNVILVVVTDVSLRTELYWYSFAMC